MNIEQLKARQARLQTEVARILVDLTFDDGSSPEYSANIRREMIDTRSKYMKVCEQVLNYEKQLKQDNQTEMEYEL